MMVSTRSFPLSAIGAGHGSLNADVRRGRLQPPQYGPMKHALSPDYESFGSIDSFTNTNGHERYKYVGKGVNGISRVSTSVSTSSARPPLDTIHHNATNSYLFRFNVSLLVSLIMQNGAVSVHVVSGASTLNILSFSPDVPVSSLSSCIASVSVVVAKAKRQCQSTADYVESIG
jgi:hypothetical protein